MNPAEAQIAAERLKALRALQGNPEWRSIAKTISDAYETHLAGSTDRGKTPVERAEHLEAFHFTKELKGIVERRIEELSAALRKYTQERDEVQSSVIDAMK